MNRRAACWVTAIVLVSASGCASVPSQEMSDARRAIQAAENVDAHTHARQTLDRGREALARAEDALGRGDYALARQAALEARVQAIDAGRLARETRATREAIEAGRAAGRPVGGATALLQRAEALGVAGDIARALEMMERARSLAR